MSDLGDLMQSFPQAVLHRGKSVCMRIPPSLMSCLLLGLTLAFYIETAEAGSLSQCEDLKSARISNVAITSADTVAAGTFKSPLANPPWGPPPDYSKLPEFCRVTGSLHPTTDSDIRFELWLPTQGWNGRFMQTGNGGAAGAIVYDSFIDPLTRGYAVANTDTGHQGGVGDFSWASGHPEKVTDYAYRAVHELTLAGKVLTKKRYGKAPVKSYWYGCSTGGRQGLKEAERYPQDYDAIVAGAPASNWVPLMSLSIVIQDNLAAPDGLPPNKLPLLRDAAVAACDMLDGVQDRVIGEPSKCGFDPASIQCRSDGAEQCLTPTEVAAARRIYRGVVSGSGTTLIPGTGPGSELLWGAYASQGFGIGTSYFRNVVAHDPEWDPATFNVDTDVARAEQADGGAAAAMNPDLSEFVAHGGKLITYHGTADGLIPYGNSVNYYNSVVAKLGRSRAEAATRLYLVPGMGHCLGGAGAYDVDWLGALEDWVEHNKPPASLPALHPASPGVPSMAVPASKAYTRPVCAYPQIARYTGHGDTSDSANFSCSL